MDSNSNPLDLPSFLVAFSYASEQKSLVLDIAEHVKKALEEGKVFVDEWCEDHIGLNGDQKLRSIFMKKSELVIQCISKEYGKKPWTQVVEARAIADLQMELGSEEASARILTLQVGEGQPENTSISTIYVDAQNKPSDKTAGTILNALYKLRPDLKPSKEELYPIANELKPGAIDQIKTKQIEELKAKIEKELTPKLTEELKVKIEKELTPKITEELRDRIANKHTDGLENQVLLLELTIDTTNLLAVDPLLCEFWRLNEEPHVMGIPHGSACRVVITKAAADRLPRGTSRKVKVHARPLFAVVDGKIEWGLEVIKIIEERWFALER